MYAISYGKANAITVEATSEKKATHQSAADAGYSEASSC